MDTTHARVSFRVIARTASATVAVHGRRLPISFPPRPHDHLLVPRFEVPIRHGEPGGLPCVA